jgi:DNA topoisomerase VI subunit A
MADPGQQNNNNGVVTFPPNWTDGLPDDEITRLIMVGWAPIERETMRDRILVLLTREAMVPGEEFLLPLIVAGEINAVIVAGFPDPDKVRLKIMQITTVLHHVLQAIWDPEGRLMINKRGLYYRLRNVLITLENGDAALVFPNKSSMYKTARHCCVLCRCNLQSLAICAGDRGFITGAASVRLIPGGQVIRLLNHKMSINGDVAAKAHLEIRGDFSTERDGVILIVESEESFDTLRQGGLCNNRPILMLTGQGYSSYATRAMLLKIHELYPAIPILALTDYNLSGYLIYEHFSGRAKTNSNSPLYDPHMPIPITWLGMNFADTVHVLNNRERLTPKEIRLINKAIVKREGQHADTTAVAPGISKNCRELIRMKLGGFKAQITDMQNIGGASLTDIVAQKIHEHLYPNGADALEWRA